MFYVDDSIILHAWGRRDVKIKQTLKREKLRDKYIGILYQLPVRVVPSRPRASSSLQYYHHGNSTTLSRTRY